MYMQMAVLTSMVQRFLSALLEKGKDFYQSSDLDGNHMHGVFIFMEQ